jgi:DNA-binding XRE family transcriptional regulator
VNGTHVGAAYVHEDVRPRYYGKGRRCYACEGPVAGHRKPHTGCEEHVVFCFGCERKMGFSALSMAEYLMKHHNKPKPPKKARERFPLPRLRDVRIERGLTRVALCAATQRKGASGVSVELIERLEGGRYRASSSTAQRLARALWVDLEELTG